MDDNKERRREERLGYQWPVWFSEDFAQTMSQGLMVDVASGGIAFRCASDDTCPFKDQHLTVRFSIPRFQGDDPTATVSITRTGQVCRVETLKGGISQIAIQFDQPLGLRPAEASTLNAMCQGQSEP